MGDASEPGAEREPDVGDLIAFCQQVPGRPVGFPAAFTWEKVRQEVAMTVYSQPYFDPTDPHRWLAPPPPGGSDGQ